MGMASPALIVRSFSLLRLVIIYLTFSHILRETKSQPTNAAMLKPTHALCIRLLTKENAFFDPETELMFRCSTSTCPGVFGCQQCCPNINKQIPSETMVNPSETKYLPPEKDPIFLSLLGIIFMLTILAILFGLVMCCKALNQKLSPTMHYSLKLNEAENESVTFPNTPCMWTKLSGRSCKMARNSTKLHVLQ